MNNVSLIVQQRFRVLVCLTLSREFLLTEKMSFGCRRQADCSPNHRAIRQKLQFAHSDGEEDSIEEANSSTGAESGFNELDSPVSLRRSSADKRPDELNSSPLSRTREDDDPESWDEEGFGSPSHLKVSFCVKNSPSPRKSPRAYDSSPERTCIQDDVDGSSSPIPDCPDTPPHKTFRKLRLFDTPHTPKVRAVLFCKNIALKLELSAVKYRVLW